MGLVEFRFEPNHPACRGHFPGNPIIPGALLLNAMLKAIEARQQFEFSAWRINSAKFLHPVRPGDMVAFEYSQSETGNFRFKASVAGTTVLTGQLQCDRFPAAV